MKVGEIERRRGPNGAHVDWITVSLDPYGVELAVEYDRDGERQVDPEAGLVVQHRLLGDLIALLERARSALPKSPGNE